MKQRIIGFDVARAYAIFGMFIVNFNFSFGSVMNPSGPMGRFLNIFTGNSTAIFIICAGMGLSLMAAQCNSEEERLRVKSVILKRSWLLLLMGLLVYNWWAGDILHFYGGYMHIAVLLLFVRARTYWILAIAAVVIFHLLLFVIPIEQGWDFVTFRYVDFWSVPGFLRNTFYNGWNSIFPWISYFLVGMWLGRLDWRKRSTKGKIFIGGFLGFVLIQIMRALMRNGILDTSWNNYLMAEYFPAYLPFILVTMAFAFMAISTCMFLGEKFAENKVILALQKTGQMTLTHYIFHLTLGMIILARLTGKGYTGLLEDEVPTSPLYIFVYAAAIYMLSIVFSVMWSRKFKNGPIEMLMRKISG